MIEIEVNAILEVKFTRSYCYFLASHDVDAGDVVLVDGSISKGDGLKALYKVVAAGTHPDHEIDGPFKVNLANGLQAELVSDLNGVRCKSVNFKV